MTEAFDLRIYEDLRERLVDRTRRNRLLHFKHGGRAKIVRVVDELPDRILEHLQNDGRFRFRPLPDPSDDLRDEQTPEFRTALTTARITDKDYRAAMAALDQDDPSTSAMEDGIERELRDRVREQLGPVDKPRPNADASEQDESHEAGGEFVIPSGDAALLLEMPNEALNP